jgi:hypothetical protein
MLLPNISTSILLMELRNRLSDRLDDPEPQYDVVLSNTPLRDLRELETALESISLYTPEPEEV